jgi:hypothetical protein
VRPETLLCNNLGVDGGGNHGNREDFTRGQVQGEVVGIAFMHDFHTKVGTVDDVSPGVDDTSLRVNDGLVEVESVQVEGHGGDTHGSAPYTKDGPQGKEEVEGTRVVERSILEDQTSEVSMGGNNVVGLFFLSELVSIVGGLILSGFSDQGGGDQRSMHGREKGSTKDTGNTGHVERVHEDVVFSLEDQHEVECSRDTKGHTIRERSLANGVGQEDSSGGSNRGREGNKDPRAHTKTVR